VSDVLPRPVVTDIASGQMTGASTGEPIGKQPAPGDQYDVRNQATAWFSADQSPHLKNLFTRYPNPIMGVN
jgi:hypothetical protein